MRNDNDNNEPGLEKEYEKLDSVSEATMVTLMETNNKTEILNEQLKKEEKLRKEQLEEEDKKVKLIRKKIIS